MKKITIALFTAITFFSFSAISAQVGVGTATPRGALDVNSSTTGFIPPQVALTSLIVEAPVTNPQGGGLANGTFVWNTNTAGVLPNNVSPGLYYWNGVRWISVAGSPGGLDWSIIGNGGIDGGTVTADGANFIGTYDNTNVDIRTNGVFRARVSSLGEFFIGAHNTILTGDLMNGVAEGNATFPWAVNGYTNQDGGGVYGRVAAGASATALYGAVQGEYYGSNSRGTGVRGLGESSTAGVDFVGDANSGVNGSIQNSVSRSFGVQGTTGTNLAVRTGGVLGTDALRSGGLGYYSSAGTSYSFYGFGTAVATGASGGRSTGSNLNTSIGLGIYGGVIGGWIKGNEYGTVFTGERFANYNQGKTITNESYIVLDAKTDGSKVASYATTSMSLDIQDKGKGKLLNGTTYIAFNKEYSAIIDNKKPIIVTVTPFGESNGIHIVSVDKNGFTIKENKGGASNVEFNWIAIAEKTTKATPISKEILSADFDKNLNGIMHDENLDGGKAIWSENGEVKFGDKAPINQQKVDVAKKSNCQRPK